ncbi:MAG: PASTA domain-containing protein [Lachnospiraceae bacterium]|nr:PASTA domain-containing protein [Lachnospiraceae bacterium]
MPQVKGKSVEEARNALTDLGLKSEVEYEETDEIEAGEVISANVEAGSEIEVGSTIKLVASAGPQGVEVPSVVGLSFEDASSRLKSQGFEVTKAEEYSGEVEENIVISQVPSAETKAAKGSNITITVSQGKEPIWVPKLVGFSEQDGIAIALEAGLQIGDVAYVYHSEYPEGQICYQSHSINAYVAPDTAIDIQVSKGPEPEAAPTYKCNASIMAPSPEEAPDYVAGTEVAVTFVTDDGKMLLETKTASFPLSANYSGLNASGGTITMVYTVIVGGSTATDPTTGEEVNVPGTPEPRSFTRRIEFVQE